MRILDRNNDTLLAVALIVSALVVLHQPLRLLVDAAGDIENRYQVDLIPGLTVLTCALLFHLYRRRQQARTAAAVAQAHAAQERARAIDLEPFAAFSRALGNTITPPAVPQMFWRYVSPFAGDRELWLMTAKPYGWDRLIRHEAGSGERSAETIEATAAIALAGPARTDRQGEGILVGDDLCFHVVVGDCIVGVVGVRNTPELSPIERRGLSFAVSLLAIAFWNVQLLTASRESSVRDQLTGCFNRSYGIETLAAELKRANRSQRPLSVMMFDVDLFKTVNDQYGHVAGDVILKAVADHVAKTLRATDVKCRYGGDEFLVILTDTPLSGAERAAEGLTREIGRLEVSTHAGVISPTISIGVAAAEHSDSDPLSLIARADAALYEAKKGGRNQYSVALPSDAHTAHEDTELYSLDAGDRP